MNINDDRAHAETLAAIEASLGLPTPGAERPPQPQDDFRKSEFVTRDEAAQIARDAVPESLRDLDLANDDTATPPRGEAKRVLYLGRANTDGDGNNVPATAYYAPLPAALADLDIKGDKVLFKGVFLREYDADGVLVAPESSLDPADYADQATYEAALTAAEHTLKPTWDWMRIGTQPGGFTPST